MKGILSRPSRVRQIAAAVIPLIAIATAARADIFTWQYINPADPGQGKQQSTTLAPDGAGVDAVPGAGLQSRNLTMAYLIGADLTGATGYYANLTAADLSQANLTNATFYAATLTGADFRQANLTSAYFGATTLTDADFTGAEVRGASFNNEESCGELISCRGADGITLPQLYSTASYQAHDLTGINLGWNVLSGGNFAGQNLTNASFFAASLTDADFAGANIKGANFDRYITSLSARWNAGTGISPGQLYTTASYQAKDLSGINFSKNDLASANFAGQNLSNADFLAANLTGANLREANLTNASFFYYGCDFQGVCFTALYATLIDADLAAADARGAFLYEIPASAFTTTNLIRPAGHINGLDLDAGGLLVVRDYDGDPTRTDRLNGTPTPIPPIPITVDQHLAMGPGGTLRMVFDADAWDSTISFAPGIPVALGGTLELTFASDVNLTGQLGRTFDLFDWTGVAPAGAFAISSPYAWNLSNLYTTGEVTLVSIPEPNTLFLFSLGLLALLSIRRVAFRTRAPQIAAAVIPLIAIATAAQADIFQWEYINPADPSQGKRQSTTLAPDGAGVNAVPGADLSGRNLSMAYLISADLTGARGEYANLSNADLSQANLTNASFLNANLSDYNLTNSTNITGAEVRGANFSIFESPLGGPSGTGLMLSQLYSTASYQSHDLRGVGLSLNNLSGGNFVGQNLSNANFGRTRLTNADFSGAEIRGANFDATSCSLYGCGADESGLTLNQLYSTASYQAGDLSGTNFGFHSFSGANFAGQNLNHASFSSATLTDADFTGADVRGASFDRQYGNGTGITLTQLYSTASYQAHDLSEIDLGGNDLSGGNFAGQNLTNANFTYVTLTDADFTGAEVRGANLGLPGITLTQLYSTASYQAHNLSGVNLDGSNLAGGNFAGQNLTNASFRDANLTGANFREANLTNALLIVNLTGVDLTAADTRGAYIDFPFPVDFISTNRILPDGHINGLDLDAGNKLVVRDYDGGSAYLSAGAPIPISVDQHLLTGPGGTLRMVFEADAWDSTISFAPDIPVALGGTLELTFAPDVNLASQVGRTFDLFDWTGVNPTGTFAISSPYAWDLSNLYTTGEVTLTAVPEPSNLALVGLGVLGLATSIGRSRWGRRSCLCRGK